MKNRLLCILEHPTQYDPGLWARLETRGVLKPEVCYLRGASPDDPEMATKIEWGIPVGKGYSMATLRMDQVIARVTRADDLAAVLTAGWTLQSTWRGWSAAAARRAPVIVASDTILATRRSQYDRLHWLKNQLFDGFFTTGSLGVEALERMGVKSDQIATGLYPVDVAFWRKQLAQEQGQSEALRTRMGTGRSVVVAVTKLSERENPLRVVDALHAFSKRDRDAQLILVGDGPLRPRVEAHIDALGLRGRVHMAGFVKYPLLARYYGAADVFLHAANVEPWGISVAEAMACGLPCVTTRNIGSARELLVEGETGSFAEDVNPESIANALERAVKLKAKPETSGAIARSVSRNDVDASAQQLEELVARMPQRKRGNVLAPIGRALLSLINSGS